MKALYTALAIFQLRWANADLARAEMLSVECDAAYEASRTRSRLAERLMRRAGLGGMFDTRR